MTGLAPIRSEILRAACAVCIAAGLPGLSLAQAPAQADPVVLDRVVAVVNHQSILASEVDEEVRLAVLDPGHPRRGSLTSTRALDQLISRTLIQQQIRQQDVEAVQPSAAEVDSRLTEIRKDLPACALANCLSDAGWTAFLAAHQLTPERVESYMRNRLEILKFIEQRFREGIRISPQQVETYYRENLLPLYPSNETAPPLERVSARIEEILLQQQVNVLFEDWLKNLRGQGDIEVLDPALGSQEPNGDKDPQTGADGL